MSSKASTGYYVMDADFIVPQFLDYEINLAIKRIEQIRTSAQVKRDQFVEVRELLERKTSETASAQLTDIVEKLNVLDNVIERTTKLLAAMEGI